MLRVCYKETGIINRRTCPNSPQQDINHPYITVVKKKTECENSVFRVHNDAKYLNQLLFRTSNDLNRFFQGRLKKSRSLKK